MPVQDLPSQGLLRWLLQRHLLAMVPGATLLDVACAVVSWLMPAQDMHLDVLESPLLWLLVAGLPARVP